MSRKVLAYQPVRVRFGSLPSLAVGPARTDEVGNWVCVGSWKHPQNRQNYHAFSGLLACSAKFHSYKACNVVFVLI